MKRLVSIGLIDALLILTVFACSMPDMPYNFKANAQASLRKVFDDAEEIVDQKIYNTATLEDDFTDDTVILVLNREATRRFEVYTPENFPEIDCDQVYDLTAAIVDYAEAIITGNTVPYEEMLVDVTEFRRILSIELKVKSKENVRNRQLERWKFFVLSKNRYKIFKL